jgi:hypothetical protein
MFYPKLQKKLLMNRRRLDWPVFDEIFTTYAKLQKKTGRNCLGPVADFSGLAAR